MPPNFKVFTIENLRKINSQRRALSQPTIVGPPVMTKGQVQYVPEGEMGGEPATCYNCHFYNYGRSCRLLGERIQIRKLTYPPKPTADAKQIEYWPCCSAWMRGEPNYGREEFVEELSSVDTMGLGWINAPQPGCAISGANCSGKNEGDDCDHYITNGDDKRAEPTAFCRVLQQQVEGGAVCSAWMDDDWLSYDRAQNILKECDGPATTDSTRER
jgi:hypothetical protein